MHNENEFQAFAALIIFYIFLVPFVLKHKPVSMVIPQLEKLCRPLV